MVKHSPKTITSEREKKKKRKKVTTTTVGLVFVLSAPATQFT